MVETPVNGYHFFPGDFSMIERRDVKVDDLALNDP